MAIGGSIIQDAGNSSVFVLSKQRGQIIYNQRMEICVSIEKDELIEQGELEQSIRDTETKRYAERRDGILPAETEADVEEMLRGLDTVDKNVSDDIRPQEIARIRSQLADRLRGDLSFGWNNFKTSS